MKQNLLLKDSKKINFLFHVENEELIANISPCSWMYPNYGLKIEVLSEKKENKSHTSKMFLFDKSIKFNNATQKDVVNMLKSISFSECTAKFCSNLQFNDRESNRNGRCEKCFVSKNMTSYYNELLIENKKEIEECEKEIKNGKKFTIQADVHSESGDDKSILVFSNLPFTKQQLSKLKKDYNAINFDYVQKNITDFLNILNKQQISIKEKINEYKIKNF